MQTVDVLFIQPIALISIYVLVAAAVLRILIRTLRFDDGDGNGNATKAIGLISKTTILHVNFLFISLPSLHDYDVKMPNFTMYRGSTQATTNFPLSS